MQVAVRKPFRLAVAIFVLLSAIFSSVPVYAQGRGHAYGREKKTYRFVNGHDARNGRWDRRGPRFRRNRLYVYRVYTRNRGWRDRHHRRHGVRYIYRYRRY